MKDCQLGDLHIKILIPALNEAKSIGDMILRLRQMGFKDILIVDGHSHDSTVECARTLGAKVISQNGNGKGDALRQAFEMSFDSDAIVMMDADGSMAPEEIPSFIETVRSGADVVKGSRFLPYGKSADITPVRRIGNKMLAGLTNFLFLTKYTDLCYGFIAFSKKALKKLSPCLKGQKFEIETEICIKAKTSGLKVVEIPSFERARLHGESNLHTFRDGFNILSLILSEFLRMN